MSLETKLNPSEFPTLKSSEQNAKILDLLQQSAHERQANNDRLKNLNEEVKSSALEKERETEAFVKHPRVYEMVSEYENLVKDKQQELEKQKWVVILSSDCSLRCLINELDLILILPQLPKANIDYCESTYVWEGGGGAEKTYRAFWFWFQVRSPVTISSVCPCNLRLGTEMHCYFRWSGKRSVLPPSPGETSDAYLTADESFQDIEPIEVSPNFHIVRYIFEYFNMEYIYSSDFYNNYASDTAIVDEANENNEL